MTTTFFYDLTGRLIRSSSTDGSEYRYDYDLNNNLTKLYQGAAGSNRTTQYTYDADNRPVTTTAGGKTITDTYNATGTRANRTYGFTTPYTVALSYLPGANGSKTGMVQTYQNGSEDAYAYEYDANGNITSITQGWSQATYTYDDMNQLVRVNDGFAKLTTTYTYDLSGNILERNEYDFTTGTLGTPTDTVAYTYNTTWRDQLASYGGQAITYDAVGNPLLYRGYTLTWQGKRLSTLSGNGTDASCTYNEQGVRTSKTDNSNEKWHPAFSGCHFHYNRPLLLHLHHSRESSYDNDRCKHRDDRKPKQERYPPLRKSLLFFGFFFGFLFLFVGYFHRLEDFNLDLNALLILFPFGIFVSEHASAVGRAIFCAAVDRSRKD